MAWNCVPICFFAEQYEDAACMEPGYHVLSKLGLRTESACIQSHPCAACRHQAGQARCWQSVSAGREFAILSDAQGKESLHNQVCSRARHRKRLAPCRYHSHHYQLLRYHYHCHQLIHFIIHHLASLNNPPNKLPCSVT